MDPLSLLIILSAAAASGIGALIASELLNPTVNLDIGTLGRRSSLTEIFAGVAPQKTVRVSGADLNKHGKYKLSNASLVIDGDVPDGARITVDGGKIFVNGKVGEKARLHATVPEDITSSTTFITTMAGKTPVITPIITHTFNKYVHDQDKLPAIFVTGDLERGARIASNHGFALGGDLAYATKIEHTREAGFANVRTGNVARQYVDAILKLT